MNSHNRENATTSLAGAACSLTQAADFDEYFDHLLAATLELTGVRELASYQSRSEVDSNLFRLLNRSGRALHNRPRPDTIPAGRRSKQQPRAAAAAGRPAGFHNT
jgi:hypothetical protein